MSKKSAVKESKMEIYTTPDGLAQIEVRFEGETFWATQRQIAAFFQTSPQNITMHLRNLYEEQEIDEQATCKQSLQVQIEGEREVRRKQMVYNLDAILSIGYRVNSKRGTQFRQWATQRLKDYLLEGMAINERRLAQKNQEVQILHDGIRIISRAIEDLAATGEYVWLTSYDNQDQSPTSGLMAA
jgi:hypothetical protein